ncbi:Pyruvate/Phosphoenolpyruvate kinase-like domain-containing protein [Cantharellus anzutake]|uniref:Pyruvate/Phosphoenolpyruvate kinase-like domain-containing protein n=1 Tax=Cantharellus anzutake TaxID=1750568 RepID=UPI001903585D|nr:Pyruvate/Phosphoenolpyruvate kinase-like domain-containing protein [Cantharellus anzutake]KAF8326833.1 Pyruvate/Phosphoenolpyruvate kinase-like domain-containing protein [Cantharellus anzutake]
MLAKSRVFSYPFLTPRRPFSTDSCVEKLRRSWLYVPCSNARMLEKSTITTSDMVIYDLEDSVAPSQKSVALNHLLNFLVEDIKVAPYRRAVRINAIDTKFFTQDVHGILSVPRGCQVQTWVVPKVHSAQHLTEVGKHIPSGLKLDVVASIESAQALWAVGEIAGWKHPDLRIIALLFAAEDYCADTGVLRSKSRSELLYARSKIVSASKAFGLQSIDMVCVDYKDPGYLLEECRDGRALGYDGKQAIHPTQVEIIQSTFLPTEKEIARAAKILHGMERARKAELRGAFGLELDDGAREMIDEPMVKQANAVLAKAIAANLPIPK